MFKNDKLTVKRKTYEVKEGEVVYSDSEIIYENIPCHLSINLNNTVREKNIPYLFSEFTLFLNYDKNISINENDILLITTDKNQQYELYAGEIKIYRFSIQIRCKQQKTIESEGL